MQQETSRESNCWLGSRVLIIPAMILIAHAVSWKGRLASKCLKLQYGHYGSCMFLSAHAACGFQFSRNRTCMIL